MLAFDPRESAGVEAGRNPQQAVAPGGQRVYTVFASPEVGETTALIRDWGNVLTSPGWGATRRLSSVPREHRTASRHRDGRGVEVAVERHGAAA